MPFAKGLFDEKIELLLSGRLRFVHQGETDGVVAAGDGTVFVNRTPLRGDKGTFPGFGIQLHQRHRQLPFAQGKGGGILIEKLLGREFQPLAQPQYVIGGEEDFDVAATLVKTSNLGVAAKLKLIFAREADRIEDIAHLPRQGTKLLLQ